MNIINLPYKLLLSIHSYIYMQYSTIQLNSIDILKYE